MDPRRNPYAPGAGTPPPELAGRDDLLERVAVSLDRIRAGRAARSFILYGLRGVGKTVLLNRVREEAEARGMISVRIEAPEGRSLPATLAPPLRTALLRLDRRRALTAAGSRALRALAGFSKALKVRYADIEVALDLEAEVGLADSGDLESDLSALLMEAGRAAGERDTAIVLFIDELQYVPEDQLAALTSALHESSQRKAPVTMLGAGLPQLLGQMGRAKSYAERLFEFVPIDRLTREAGEQALRIPAEQEGAALEPGAVDEILKQTHGYPYFLQEWGKHSWNVAELSPVTRDDVVIAGKGAMAELDDSFFRVRFDRLTPSEKRYMRAMAELGAGPHRSGDVADQLGRPVASVAPIRSSLIAKGMIYSPAHGDTAFTVPLFDGFMKRIMP